MKKQKKRDDKKKAALLKEMMKNAGSHPGSLGMPNPGETEHSGYGQGFSSPHPQEQPMSGSLADPVSAVMSGAGEQ